MHFLKEIEQFKSLGLPEPGHFISVHFIGGLGNQLFQLGTALKLANKHNYQIILNKNFCYKPLAGNFPEYYQDNVYRNFTFSNYLIFHHILKQNSNSFCQFPEIPPATIVEDYFQDYRYLDRELCLKFFSPSEQIKEYLVNKYGDLSQYTSLHVRRGDYINFPLLHPCLELEYYARAVEIINPSKILICSDDLAWCREHLPFSNCLYIDEEKDYMSLYLMSLCRNNIIANSTFSWWSAYLNEHSDKQVVLPEKWYGANLAHLDCTGFRLPGWKII